MAEQAVREGTADLVEMTRAQIADPDLARKLTAGTPEQIRPCVLCNQRCQVRDARNPLVACIGEPSSGYEWDETPPVPAGPAGATGWTDRRVPVLVVGAGPGRPRGGAGGRPAGSRGHRGRARPARRGEPGGGGPGCRPGPVGRAQPLAGGGVPTTRRSFELGTEADGTRLDRARAAGIRVIVCTGSLPPLRRFDTDGTVPEWRAADLLGAWGDVAAGRADRAEGPGAPPGPPEGHGRLPAGPVVVDDPAATPWGSAWPSCWPARAAPSPWSPRTWWPGTQLARTGDLAPANARLARAGVRCASGRWCERCATAPCASRTATPGRSPSWRRPCWSRRPSAARRPPGGGPARRGAAGDAVAPRTVYEAVLEGRRAAMALGDAGPARRERDRPLPVALLPAAHRSGGRAQPHRLLGPPHQLRRGRAAERAARRLLRGPGGRRRRPHHHRGALDPPDRLALREADPRLPSRRSCPATAASPRRSTATTRRSSPRSTTTGARARACTAACRCGRPRRCRTRCSARCPRRSPSPRSPRSSTATPLVAGHCREGGFDGVELQCSHSSIVRGFLSPATNRRTDAYGGALEHRARLLLADRGGRARGRSAPTWHSGCGCAATS